MSTVEPLYNRHHWDQQTCPFNRGVLCWGVIQCNKVSKWDKISVWLPLFRGVLYKGFHCACTQCIQSLIDTHTHTHTHTHAYTVQYYTWTVKYIALVPIAAITVPRRHFRIVNRNAFFHLWLLVSPSWASQIIHNIWINTIINYTNNNLS